MKDFQVKIVHQYRAVHGMFSHTYDYYTIEWSLTSLLGVRGWFVLKEFKSAAMAYPEDAGWERIVVHMERAEEIARSLKSMEDVKNHYLKQQEKEKQWKAEYEAYLSSFKPIVKEKRIV